MIESVRKFIFQLLILTLLLTCLGYGLYTFVLPESYFPLFPIIPAFLFIVTLLVHVYQVRASAGDSRKFTSKYLGAMGLKILIYLCFIIIFLLVVDSSVVPFLISFLVMYIAFTIFEVISILNSLKNKS